MKFRIKIIFSDKLSFTTCVDETDAEYAKSAAWNKAIAAGFNKTPIEYLVTPL